MRNVGNSRVKTLYLFGVQALLFSAIASAQLCESYAKAPNDKKQHVLDRCTPIPAKKSDVSPSGPDDANEKEPSTAKTSGQKAVINEVVKKVAVQSGVPVAGGAKTPVVAKKPAEFPGKEHLKELSTGELQEWIQNFDWTGWATGRKSFWKEMGALNDVVMQRILEGEPGANKEEIAKLGDKEKLNRLTEILKHDRMPDLALAMTEANQKMITSEPRSFGTVFNDHNPTGLMTVSKLIGDPSTRQSTLDGLHERLIESSEVTPKTLKSIAPFDENWQVNVLDPLISRGFEDYSTAGGKYLPFLGAMATPEQANRLYERARNALNEGEPLPERSIDILAGLLSRKDEFRKTVAGKAASKQIGEWIRNSDDETFLSSLKRINPNLGWVRPFPLVGRNMDPESLSESIGFSHAYLDRAMGTEPKTPQDLAVLLRSVNSSLPLVSHIYLSSMRKKKELNTYDLASRQKLWDNLEKLGKRLPDNEKLHNSWLPGIKRALLPTK